MTIKTDRRLCFCIMVGMSVALAACSDGGEETVRINESSNAPVQKSVTIKRDEWGVPHVYADDTKGLFYGYGYALAVDRMFQMEMIKRSVLGTVSAVL